MEAKIKLSINHLALSTLLNRSVLPITSTLVTPELTVEPQDVRENRPSASNDSPTSNLLYNSLLSRIRVQCSTKFKHTWITGIPCNRMIRSRILVLSCPYWLMMSLGILLLMLALTCLSSVIPAGYAVKTFNLLLRKKLQLSPPQKLPVSFIFFRSAAHYLPRIWDHIGVRCVESSGLPTVLTPFWRFRLLVRLCPLHSPLGCVHKIWNYEGWNQRPNFVIEFVDPVENMVILRQK